MAESNCKLCGLVFAYDVEIGLNVARFEMEQLSRGVFLGGIMPCCPNCGARCPLHEEWSEIKFANKMQAQGVLRLTSGR